MSVDKAAQPTATAPSEGCPTNQELGIFFAHVRYLLEWMPTCSVGSSGYERRKNVERWLERFGEDGSLKSAVGVKADLEHPGNDTGGEISESAYGAEIERETFEKACKAMCSRCAYGMPRKVVDESRHGMPHKPSTGVSEWWHGGAYCRATPIRNAFPHLAKPEGK